MALAPSGVMRCNGVCDACTPHTPDGSLRRRRPVSQGWWHACTRAAWLAALHHVLARPPARSSGWAHQRFTRMAVSTQHPTAYQHILAERAAPVPG